MDIFKAKQHKKCGRGGLHCSCCNDYRGNKNEKAKLNRIVRRGLKQELETLKDEVASRGEAKSFGGAMLRAGLGLTKEN